MMKCKEIGCRMFNSIYRNNCSGLVEAIPEDCPFFKTEVQYRNEVRKVNERLEKIGKVAKDYETIYR